MRKLLLTLRPRTTTWTESQALTWKLFPQAVMKPKHFSHPPLLPFFFSAAASQDPGGGAPGGSGTGEQGGFSWCSDVRASLNTFVLPGIPQLLVAARLEESRPRRVTGFPKIPVPSDRLPVQRFGTESSRPSGGYATFQG